MVKPLALMRWLVRLVTPPGGLVLDPFAGSGTTLIAAHQEGFRALGIEREAEYVKIARARIAHWTKEPGESSVDKIVVTKPEAITVAPVTEEPVEEELTPETGT